jgi:predicted 3-demethylubiquinone-9 3-methyltransferase (glyoxalase superfamily)
MTVDFELGSQSLLALNGGPQYQFTPAISLMVNCATQEEVDRLWEKLTAGGGKPGPCAWLTDKYGVSWQIVPKALRRLIADPDPAKSQRVMKAMMRMTKIEIADLERAYAGE